VRLDAPYVVYEDTMDGGTLTAGTPTRGVVDGFTFEVIHEIRLVQGDEAEITLRSPVADSYFSVIRPGELYDPNEEPLADDGAGGLYDLDAQATVTADITGTYRIVVGTYEGIVAGYELTVDVT
jgi:hypothetical protein